MVLTEGQASDDKGAALMLPSLPKADVLLGDRGYDANWFRDALAQRGVVACIPSKNNRKVPIPHDRTLYRQRHRIENMLDASTTGDASTPVTIATPTPSWPPSSSQQTSSSCSDLNES